MTSKSLYFNLFREDGKRRHWSIALSFLLFFFTFPVRIALLISDNSKGEMDYKYIVSTLNEWLGFQNGLVAGFLILMSLIMGVSCFSYLHSRQKVDFYHGIPVSRKHLFWISYFQGIWIPGAVYGINLLVTIGIAGVSGVPLMEISGTAFKGFTLFILHYAMMYSLTVTSMVLTGNVVVGILGNLVLNFYSVCAILILEMCFSTFFRTSYGGGGYFLTKWKDRTSPFVLFVTNVGRLYPGNPEGGQGIRIFAVLAVTVALALFSFWLYKKRGLEAAGKAMAFKISMPIIRIPIVILSALSGSVFFWSLHSSAGWSLFGLLCGMVISHGVIEIIYHFDFRKLFSHWKQMLVSALLAAVVFCGFRYDLFGYDRYIPAENAIESVAVDVNNAFYWVDYGNPRKDAMGEYYWDYVNSGQYILDNMKLQDREAVMSLVKKAVARNQELNHGNDASYRRNTDGREYQFSVKYILKNGKSVYRSYWLPQKESEQEIIDIFENPDFIQTVYPILSQTKEDTAWVRLSRAGQTNIVSRDRNGTDKAMTEQLLLAYQEELRNLDAETMKRENPVATIQFMTKLQAEAEAKREELQSSWKYSEVASRGYYPVYPSFHKTLGLLRECGINTDVWTDWSDIKQISIDGVQYTSDGYDYGQRGFETISITDQEEISRIMSQAIVEEYSSMNPFWERREEDLALFGVITGSGERGQEVRYSVPLNVLSEDVKAEIEKRKNEG
ncbi:DUF6449 domain-containing protein [Lacrimispora sp.]|uniref:DUF6449 domain-containing protein n=1 Tax=Lacrimispora sp. TaxID=2719234 RepID=UPI002FDB2F52